MSAVAPKISTMARRKSLAAVDHPQPRLVGIEPSINQVGQQRLDDLGLLGTALAQAQHVLAALGVDAQSHEDHAPVEMDGRRSS